jgi:hypothetical protein
MCRWQISRIILPYLGNVSMCWIIIIIIRIQLQYNGRRTDRQTDRRREGRTDVEIERSRDRETNIWYMFKKEVIFGCIWTYIYTWYFIFLSFSSRLSFNFKNLKLFELILNIVDWLPKNIYNIFCVISYFSRLRGKLIDWCC